MMNRCRNVSLAASDGSRILTATWRPSCSSVARKITAIPPRPICSCSRYPAIRDPCLRPPGTPDSRPSSLPDTVPPSTPPYRQDPGSPIRPGRSRYRKVTAITPQTAASRHPGLDAGSPQPPGLDVPRSAGHRDDLVGVPGQGLLRLVVHQVDGELVRAD